MRLSEDSSMKKKLKVDTGCNWSIDITCRGGCGKLIHLKGKTIESFTAALAVDPMLCKKCQAKKAEAAQ